MIIVFKNQTVDPIEIVFKKRENQQLIENINIIVQKLAETSFEPKWGLFMLK